MPKRKKLIQLYLREGILVDSIEPIEHAAVCVRAQPSSNAVCTQGKESELVQDLFLAHRPSPQTGQTDLRRESMKQLIPSMSLDATNSATSRGSQCSFLWPLSVHAGSYSG